MSLAVSVELRRTGNTPCRYRRDERKTFGVLSPPRHAQASSVIRLLELQFAPILAVECFADTPAEKRRSKTNHDAAVLPLSHIDDSAEIVCCVNLFDLANQTQDLVFVLGYEVSDQGQGGALTGLWIFRFFPARALFKRLVAVDQRGAEPDWGLFFVHAN